LTGHVFEAGGRGRSNEFIDGIVFDKVVTRDGHEIPLRNVGVQAVAAAEASTASSARDAPAMMGAGGDDGISRGGGLLGRTTGAVGGTAGSGLSAAGGLGSLAGGASGALQAGPGAAGGLDPAGTMLTAGSTGVFGLRGLSLSGGCGCGLGLTHDVEREERASVPGHRFLLGSRAAASSEGGGPRPSGTAKPDSKRPAGDRR
jgi:hypothetical protein